MELFTALGFHWNRSAVPAVTPTPSLERVAFRFRRMLPEFVWDASALEGNPFTFPEVKTVLDGVTVGGRRVSDLEQVLNLAESAKHLLAWVKADTFSLDKATFGELHGLVARNEALEWVTSGARAKRQASRRMSARVNVGDTRHRRPLSTRRS